MNVVKDNYLQKFYIRNTNLNEITASKIQIHKTSFLFTELGQREVFFLWITSNILIYNILF